MVSIALCKRKIKFYCQVFQLLACGINIYSWERCIVDMWHVCSYELLTNSTDADSYVDSLHCIFLHGRSVTSVSGDQSQSALSSRNFQKVGKGDAHCLSSKHAARQMQHIFCLQLFCDTGSRSLHGYKP